MAFLGILAVTCILVIGIKESANVNTAIVAVKVSVLLVFIGLGVQFLFLSGHLSVATANWHPFIPANTGEFGDFGWSGILRGAAVIFFAYIGFDAVSTAAQEAKNPQRDMPIGILGSLVICTILYIVVAWRSTTGLMHYSELKCVAEPIALAVDVTGVRWGSTSGEDRRHRAASARSCSSCSSASRASSSRCRSDGLLWQWAGKIHPKFQHAVHLDDHPGRALRRRSLAASLPVSTLAELTQHRHAVRVHHRLRRRVDPARARARTCRVRSRRRGCRSCRIMGVLVSLLASCSALHELTRGSVFLDLVGASGSRSTSRYSRITAAFSWRCKRPTRQAVSGIAERRR